MTKRAIVQALERLDSALDHFGGLGCRLGLAALSDRLDQRWQTGVWK